MRKLVLLAIFCSSVFYAPVPLIAHKGGGQTPLIPVADMPNSGGATAPSEPPLEVDAEEVPELVPADEVGGGAEAPGGTPVRAPEPTPAPAHAPATTTEPLPPPEPVAAEPAQTSEEPEANVPPPDDEPAEETPTPEPEADEPDEEEFEEEFEDGPEPGEPQAPTVTPGGARAGPQLPRTGGDLPPLLISGLALTMAGWSLRALCAARA